MYLTAGKIRLLNCNQYFQGKIAGQNLSETKDHLLKDSFILFLATSIVNLSNFIFHMYVTRKLSPSDYGALATLLALVIIFIMPAQALLMTVAKKVSIYKAHNQFEKIHGLFKKTTKWFLILGMFYFIFFMVFSGAIMKFFNMDDVVLIVILAFISIVAILLPVVRGILQGLQKFARFGLNLISDAVFRLLSVILFTGLGFGLRGALLSSLFSALLAYVLGLFMLSEFLKIKEENIQLKKREFFGYALPVFFSMVAFSILSYMDLFIVKHFYEKEQAGLYAVTSIIGKAFLYFPMAIAMALFPKVSENFELNKNTKGLLIKSVLLTGLISFTGFLFCYFFPEFVIKLLTGGKKYLEITGVVKIFGLAILPLVLLNVIINYLLAIHRYFFIFIMYSGIIVYAGLLWFFHKTFYQVIFILFLVNLIIFILSFCSIFIYGTVKKNLKEKIVGI